MRILLLLCLCKGILPGYAQSPNPALKPISKEQWLTDIDFFDKQLVKKHGNAFHFTTKEKYDRSIAALKQDLGQLQDFEIVVRLQQIAASIGDAHTYIKLPSNFRRFPLVLYWFGKQLYVVRTTAGYSQVLGSRLFAIDDHPLDEISDKIASVLSNDENESFRLANSPSFIVIPEVLKTLGIIPATEKAVFRFE